MGAEPLRDDEELLTPNEVAELFGVTPRTLVRWEQARKLRAIRTLGGHRRYLRSQVEALRRRGASG